MRGWRAGPPLRPAEAAHLADLEYADLYRLIRSGELPSVVRPGVPVRAGVNATGKMAIETDDSGVPTAQSYPPPPGTLFDLTFSPVEIVSAPVLHPVRHQDAPPAVVRWSYGRDGRQAARR